MIFIFFFPVMLLVLFGSIFGGQDVAQGVSFGQYFLAGMIASGIMNTGFQSLALGIASDRDTDVLKRLHGTPLPSTAFFAGKLVQVLFVSIVQIAMLVVVGVAVLRRRICPVPQRSWGTFAWVFVLGTAASVALGIGMSSLLRNARAGSAVLTPVVLFLQFISGVFIVFTQVPHVPAAASRPSFRSSGSPKACGRCSCRPILSPQRRAGVGSTAPPRLCLTVWAVIGTVWAVSTFRWQRPEDR